MASSSRRDTDEGRSARTTSHAAISGSVSAWVRTSALSAVRVAAFWTAVVLPFAAVVVLASGIESTDDWLLFVVLVSSNVVSLYVGHPHKEP